MEATELISRCKAGERQALNLLYQQYKPQLLKICRQYTKEDDVAEDLLHDAFVVIFTSLDRLENDDKLEAWMYAIVRKDVKPAIISVLTLCFVLSKPKSF